jgi:hypothetical protein
MDLARKAISQLIHRHGHGHGHARRLARSVHAAGNEREAPVDDGRSGVDEPFPQQRAPRQESHDEILS